MEQFNRANPNAAQHSRASSVSSLESINDSAYSNYNGSTRSLHSRSVSLMPSYMKHAPITRKPVASKVRAPDAAGASGVTTSNQKPPPAPPPEAKGTLLLGIAASPHRSVVSYLQSMLKKSFYKQVFILGSVEQETELKQLKVDIYALLGRLGQEASVQMELRSSWDEVEVYTAVSKAVAEGDAIHGVLCSPAYENVRSSGTDIMALDQDQLGLPWKSSIGFLHSVAKFALPNFRSSGHEYKQPGLFLVTSPSEQSPTSTLYNAGCRTIMTLLVEANAGKSLTIDYAENVLLPEPGPARVKSNGGPKVPALNLTRDPKPDEYPPPDSPTKLWALYNEFASAD